MSLVFAGITPHPPMLIPSIGKETTEKLEKTANALKKIEQELYLAKPEVLIIISPHGGLFEDSFSVNAHDKFETSFEKFGDLVTKKEWTGNPHLAAIISHESHEAHLPIRLISKEKLDHGSTVPLFFLTEHLPDIKILPLGYSHKTPEDHVRFGTFLKNIIMKQDKRVAVIASGDLSHCLSDKAPKKYRPEGKEFDTSLISLLEAGKTHDIVEMDQSLIEAASQCAYHSILILLGIIHDMNTKFSVHSYESPFGVGYLVGEFDL